MKQDDRYLSVVVPLFNEEGNIDALLSELRENTGSLNLTCEIILVDDGSSDGTWNAIKRSSAVNPDIRGVRLARNFGHQHALLAGMSVAVGQVIISMDGDLQHPPSLIPEMLDRHKQGYLVVNTRRDDAGVAPFFKRKASSLFYRVFSFMTGVSMSSGSSDFRLLDRRVLNQLLQFKDMDPFLRGAVEWLGFPSSSISYAVNERFAGASKYTLPKMIRFAKGSIVSFSTKPLMIGIWLGVVTSALAALEIIYVIYRWLNGETVAGWASIIVVISFLFGVQFIMLGIMGAYLARIHVALQNRPGFVIAELTDDRQNPDSAKSGHAGA